MAKLARGSRSDRFVLFFFGRGTGSNNIILKVAWAGGHGKELVFTVSDKQLITCNNTYP